MESIVENTIQEKRKRGRPRKNHLEEVAHETGVEENQEMQDNPVPSGSREPQVENVIERNALAQGLTNHTPLLDLEPDFGGLSLLNSAQNRTRNFMDLSRVLPGFDPVKGDIDIYRWIDKIEEYADMYGWDDLSIKHYALSKLEGVARKWKDSLQRAERSWNDWKELLQKTFIGEDVGMKKVLEAQRYKRRSGQSIVEYFYEKLSRCNEARMGQRETIEWIVDGLENVQYRSYLGPLSRYGCATDLLPDLKSGDNFIRDYIRPMSRPMFVKKDGQQFGQHKSGYEEKRRTPEYVKPTTSQGTKIKDLKEITCFKCGDKGHYARDCVERRKEVIRTGNNENVLHIEGNSHAKFFKEASINDKIIKCYIDLGSAVTTLRKDYADKLDLTYFEDKFDAFTGYGGGQVIPIGVMTVKIDINGVAAKCTVYVVPNEAQVVPLLIGHSYTEQQNVHILNSNGSLKIARDIADLMKIETTEVSKTKFTTQEEIVIPKNYLGHINVIGSIAERNFYVNGSARETGNVVPQCVISTNKKGESSIPVMNLSNDEMIVKKGQVIARGEVCNEEEITREVNQEEIREEEIDSDLEPNEHTELVELLNSYRGIVAGNMRQMGKTNVTEMSIHLTTETPVCYRPYRLSYHEREQVKDMIADLKKADVIEESSSPYASPIILVRKKNGEMRMCIDYRALNKNTIKDRYPMPLIDDQIDRLRGYRFFTSLDLFSGYYQVPMSRDSKEKTAFITPDGHYQFKRMPFGLCNAPAFFQRMINLILGSLDGNTAMAYLDDIISRSQTFKDGIKKLNKILIVLMSAGVTLNLKKCHFFKQKVEYLGFEISQTGIAPGTKKLNSIKSFPIPENIKAVRSFVGLASYFRRFVKGFSTIIKPMTDLLAKNKSFFWGTEQKKAFEDIKLKLTTRPILAIYNVNGKTEVHTDASQHGLGAVLLQQQGDNLMHPISYYSRKTTNDEAKYHSYELEALAIVCALEKFRVYFISLKNFFQK